MINEGINLPSTYDYHFAAAGLGNRIASILRAMLDGMPVAWIDDAANQFSWSDFFKNDPPCEIIYVKNRRIAVENMRLAGGGWAFPLEDINRVVEEIKSWRPSEKVREKMQDIPIGTVGYKLRLLSNDRKYFDSIHIPDGCFIACDSAEEKEKHKDNCIVNIEGGMVHDNDRGGEHWLYAVADWFMLMQCEHIVEVVDSTFPNAHKACGISFNMVDSQEKLEQSVACGSDIHKYRAIETSIDDRLATFSWGQEFWCTTKEVDQKLKNLAGYLDW